MISMPSEDKPVGDVAKIDYEAGYNDLAEKVQQLRTMLGDVDNMLRRGKFHTQVLTDGRVIVGDGARAWIGHSFYEAMDNRFEDISGRVANKLTSGGLSEANKVGQVSVGRQRPSAV